VPLVEAILSHTVWIKYPPGRSTRYLPNRLGTTAQQTACVRQGWNHVTTAHISMIALMRETIRDHQRSSEAIRSRDDCSHLHDGVAREAAVIDPARVNHVKR
jgi:hypothetical protein